jgi:GntR family transcriptional repressor for pyruvate dehydrogenase complex
MARTKRPESNETLNRLAAELGPIRSQGLTESLVLHLKDCVLRGVLRPGERLPPERELAAMLRVSRSSLRQALKSLQVMSVLEVRQGSGNYLSNSAERILRDPVNLLVPLRGVSYFELYEARRAMEAEAAACAATRATPEDIDRIAVHLDLMRKAKNDAAETVKHDTAFHRRIAVASGNSVFLWFQDLVHHVLYEAMLAYFHKVNRDALIADHERILNAIRQEDPAAARTAMLKHLVLNRVYSDDRIEELELRVTNPALEAAESPVVLAAN